MAILSKKYDITFPLDAQQAENIDEMFLDLYRQLGTSLLGGVLDDFDPGSVIIVDEEGDFSELGLGTEGSFLRSGATVPAWSDLLLPNDAAQGDLLYASAADTITTLPKSTSATRYLSNTGASNNPAWAQVDLTNGVTGILPVSGGGTGTGTAFTLGSVIFAGAGGTLTEDNVNFFWDDTNNRLGLGVATPGYKLDVRHTSAASQAHVGSDSADEGGYFTAFNAFDSFVISTAAFSGSNWIAKKTTAELIALDAGTIQFSINSGVSAGGSFTPTELARLTATGFGIGVTPSHKFDVNIDPGTVGTVVFAGLGDLVGTNPLFYLQGSDGTAAIRSRNAHPLAFWTNNVEQARITTAGLFAFGGGGTSSFPALKRAAAILEVRLADDSAYAAIKASKVTATDGTNNLILIPGGDGSYTFEATFSELLLKRDATTSFRFQTGARSELLLGHNTSILSFGAFDGDIGLRRKSSSQLEIDSRTAGDYLDLVLRKLFIAGTTSSFPMLKNSSGVLEFRLADDSGYAVISASGLTTTSSINIGGAINGSSHVRAGGTGSIYWEAKASLKSPVDSVITLYNQAENNFSKLQFGGTTASFPALRRSSAVLDVVLADESAYGTLNAGAYNVGGVAGASFGPGAITSITIVNGIVTAAS